MLESVIPALVVLVSLAAAGAVRGAAPLLPSDTYTITQGPRRRQALVVTRSSWLGGSVARQETVRLSTAVQCIEACMNYTSCQHVNWCPQQARPAAPPPTPPPTFCLSWPALSHLLTPARAVRTLHLQGGCDDGIGPLAYQGCRMLSGRAPDGSCTLSPPVTGRLPGDPQDTGGRAPGAGLCAGWAA